MITHPLSNMYWNGQWSKAKCTFHSNEYHLCYYKRCVPSQVKPNQWNLSNDRMKYCMRNSSSRWSSMQSSYFHNWPYQVISMIKIWNCCSKFSLKQINIWYLIFIIRCQIFSIIVLGKYCTYFSTSLIWTVCRLCRCLMNFVYTCLVIWKSNPSISYREMRENTR